jgi:hypothetical protein
MVAQTTDRVGAGWLGVAGDSGASLTYDKSQISENLPACDKAIV